MSRKMKDSGIEWIGEIPEDWEIVKVKNIFNNHKNIVCEKENEYERLALTLNGVIKRSKEDSKGLQSESFSTYQIIYENDLVFKLIDLENVNTSRVGKSPYTGIVSPVYIILSNERESAFGYYYFLSLWHREIFNKLGGNGVRSALNLNDLNNLPYPQFDTRMKKYVAEYLDIHCTLIDQTIEKQKLVIEKLNYYRTSLISEMMSQNQICDEEYKYCHLGFLGNMKNGANFASNLEESEIAFLGVGDFKNNMILNRIDMFSTLNIASDSLSQEDYLKDGDIVFVRSNGSKELVGRSVLIENITYPLIYSGFCIRFRNNRSDIIDNKYLLYFFKSNQFRQILNLESRGSNISNLSQDMLAKIRIEFPSIISQKQIVKYLDTKYIDIENAIGKKKETLEKLESYKKSLIYECVTGKREVN